MKIKPTNKTTKISDLKDGEIGIIADKDGSIPKDKYRWSVYQRRGNLTHQLTGDRIVLRTAQGHLVRVAEVDG